MLVDLLNLKRGNIPRMYFKLKLLNPLFHYFPFSSPPLPPLSFTLHLLKFMLITISPQSHNNEHFSTLIQLYVAIYVIVVVGWLFCPAVIYILYAGPIKTKQMTSIYTIQCSVY